VISEEDLRLRGAGELLGTKQSGLADFKFVDFILHQDLFSKTGEIANSIIAEDPELQEPKHQSLKMLLRIFGYHQCLKYLKS